MKADIRRQGHEVVVFDAKGKEIYRAERSEANIAVAHNIYMGEKYKNNDPASEEEIWIPIKAKS